MYLKKHSYLTKLLAGARQRCLALIALEVGGKKGKSKDSHDISSEWGTKEFDRKRESVFPRPWIISLSFGLIFIMNS